MDSMNWHKQNVSDTFAALGSGLRGLPSDEARTRLAKYGPNTLPSAKPERVIVIFFRQFQSPLIYLLAAASVIVLLTGDPADGAIIFAVLLFNAIVGTVQEGKAQNTLLALRKFVETKATVLRGGEEMIVNDQDVVPGDVIVLSEGEKVPADARVVGSANLNIDEASLSGESEPVHKIVEPLPEDGGLAHKNMVYKGTAVAAGRGLAVVVATGTRTAIGGIAERIVSIDTEIPLKANIRNLSRIIIGVALAIGALVFLLGFLTGRDIRDLFATVVSLSVSIVPEGLPVVVTLILAMGVWRMGKRQALIKKLQAVEALGQARVIAVDKTGTITKNEMVVERALAGGAMFEIGGYGYEPEGEVRLGGVPVDAANHPELLFLGKMAAFSSGAHVIFSEDEKRWRVSGDPTEAALLVLSQKLGFHKSDLETEHPLVADMPFDYRRKYHATLHADGSEFVLTVTGAPEAVLPLCALSSGNRSEFEKLCEEMSGDGLRVIACGSARRNAQRLAPDDVRDLSFAGFFAMKDAVRPEAAGAIAAAAAAGIRIVMITGDHAVTARAIARDAGIWQDGDRVLTGRDIEGMSASELRDALARTSVFARVTPDHKMRIIEAYRARGEVVAMTGDGVNDAPSLVAADLGVAMGKTGTEVAKEASDIVLLDDNLSSIVAAIEEGRNIYKTIQKVMLYLFSTNIGEVLTITGALFLGYPIPILPAQIIWLNFVTDGFLDIALAAEPKEKNLLDGRFEKPGKYLIDRLMGARMLLMSLVMAAGALFLFHRYADGDLVKAQTMALSTMAAFQWLNAWNCRSDRKSVFAENPFSNPWLVAATAFVIALQMAAVYHPVMQKFLHTAALGLGDWALVLGTASLILVAEETRKAIVRLSRP